MPLDIVIFRHNYILIYSNTELPYIPIYTHKYQYTPIYTHTYPYIPIYTWYLPINTYPDLCISMVVIGPPIIYLSSSKRIVKRGSKNVNKIKGVNWWQIHTHIQIEEKPKPQKSLPTLQLCLSLIFLSCISSIHKVLHL